MNDDETPGAAIASATATAGETSATLTLPFSGTLAEDAKLKVWVLATAHRQAGDLTTGAITVPPVPGFALAPATNRLRTKEAGDTATFTVKLDCAPSGNMELDVTSSDTGEGTVMPARLTFTPSDWSEAQTVTGMQDTIDDGDAAWNVRLDSSIGLQAERKEGAADPELGARIDLRLRW